MTSDEAQPERPPGVADMLAEKLKSALAERDLLRTKVARLEAELTAMRAPHEGESRAYAVACGGRDYQGDVDAARRFISVLRDYKITHLLHGGCRGADAFAESTARKAGIWTCAVPAPFSEKGRKAGPLRNAEMAEMCRRLNHGLWGLLVAFPGGRGTESMVAQAIGFKVVRIQGARHG